jgi:hypothetical protein
MALGGGVWTTQNKVLPGSYINFVSANRATSTLADRGIVALPISLDWGSDEVFTVTNDDFIDKCEKIFGYSSTSEQMQDLREVFKHAREVHVCRLNANGVKASNDYATAKFGGVRGNDIKIVINKNIDDTSKFDVVTYLDTTIVDTQTVTLVTELKANDFVDFKADATLTETAGVALAGGTNGTTTGDEWNNALALLEAYSFNVLICNSTDDTIKALCVEYTKRLRDEMGVKFQVVVHKYSEADSEAVISVENNLVGEIDPTAKLVYWVGGAEADCDVNKSCTNKVYDGELAINVKYTQRQLEEALKTGKLIFHKVGDDVRVLEDINTLVTYTTEKNVDFKYNQTIRVIDQIANDIATLFNTRYLGIIPNDNAGRISLWNDIVKHHQELQRLRAIEDFEPDDVVIRPIDGNKKAVAVTDNVTVVNAMAQMYMTVIVA